LCLKAIIQAFGKDFIINHIKILILLV
jgi:hypothetical protein